MPEKENGRTHEPNLRELTAELDGLRDLFISKLDWVKDVIDERDKLYKERDEKNRTAVDAALKAADTQTKASFEASEKAIVKAESAQRDYNVRSNEFRGQLEDQAKRLLSRDEYISAHANIQEKIDRVDTDVRRIQTLWGELVGGKERGLESKQQNQWVIGLIIGLCVAAADIAVKLIGK